jgi:hypothetical protein
VGTVDVAGMTRVDVDGVAGYTVASTISGPNGTMRHLVRR